MTAIAFDILRTLGTWDRGSLYLLNLRQQDNQYFLVIPVIADQTGNYMGLSECE